MTEPTIKGSTPLKDSLRGVDPFFFPVKWVKLSMLEKINNYTVPAARGKIKAGIWKERQHWKKAPDGNIMVNPRAIDDWIDSDGKAA